MFAVCFISAEVIPMSTKQILRNDRSFITVSYTGTGQNSIRKAGKRATRGGGRGHRKNLKQSIGESNDATAAATVALGDVGTEVRSF